HNRHPRSLHDALPICIHALSPHLTQDTEPVASWQHNVEHDRVVCLSENLSECRTAVMHKINHKILLCETIAQKASKFFFVFDDQDRKSTRLNSSHVSK